MLKNLEEYLRNLDEPSTETVKISDLRGNPFPLNTSAGNNRAKFTPKLTPLSDVNLIDVGFQADLHPRANSNNTAFASSFQAFNQTPHVASQHYYPTPNQFANMQPPFSSITEQQYQQQQQQLQNSTNSPFQHSYSQNYFNHNDQHIRAQSSQLPFGSPSMSPANQQFENQNMFSNQMQNHHIDQSKVNFNFNSNQFGQIALNQNVYSNQVTNAKNMNPFQNTNSNNQMNPYQNYNDTYGQMPHSNYAFNQTNQSIQQQSFNQPVNTIYLK